MWTLNRDDISHPTDAYGRLPVLGPETRADRCAFIVIGSAMFDGKAVGHLAVTGLLLACLLVRCQIVGMSVRSRDTKFPESFNSLKKKVIFPALFSRKHWKKWTVFIIEQTYFLRYNQTWWLKPFTVS